MAQTTGTRGGDGINITQRKLTSHEYTIIRIRFPNSRMRLNMCTLQRALPHQFSHYIQSNLESCMGHPKSIITCPMQSMMTDDDTRKVWSPYWFSSSSIVVQPIQCCYGNSLVFTTRNTIWNELLLPLLLLATSIENNITTMKHLMKHILWNIYHLVKVISVHPSGC